MSAAEKIQGLTVEVDDDVLVENAATATLFSPGMWVQRPTRTPLARRDAAADIRRRWVNGAAQLISSQAANPTVQGGHGST